MTDFNADWLRMREPFDHDARQMAMPSLGLSGHVAGWQRSASHGVVEVVDLACGSGANLRELAPRIGGLQHWRLIDHDPALLAAVPCVLADWATQVHGDGRIHLQGDGFSATVDLQCVDLARAMSSVDLSGVHLVTGSAILDLVSEDWLSGLIQQAKPSRAALLFALSVDGRSTWGPVNPQDDRVHALFTQHQRRDKGFGPALGIQAVSTALRQLALAGYCVTQGQSDWQIQGEEAQPMQATMIDGIAAAAIEQNPAQQAMVRGWALRRKHLMPQSRLLVGHVDFLATWPSSSQIEIPQLV